MAKAIRISAGVIGLLTLIGVVDCASDPVRQSPCEGPLSPIHTLISDPDAKAATPP